MVDATPKTTMPNPSGVVYSSLAASASVNVGTWLFIGGIARGDREYQSSFDAEFLVAICFILQFLATLATVALVDVARPTKGRQMFAAGMIGMGITAFYVMPLSSVSGATTLFWVLGGMYFGWLIELVAGIFGRLARALAGDGR